jgi:ABC-type transport system involved in multi-copper enzyme maturation permease subunit
MLLSYPVKREQLFLSKFIALFTVLFSIYATVYFLQIYLLVLNPFEPLFYASLLFFAIQLLLVCVITTVLSLITKNEIISILVMALMLFGLENIAVNTSLASFIADLPLALFIPQQIQPSSTC